MKQIKIILLTLLLTLLLSACGTEPEAEDVLEVAAPAATAIAAIETDTPAPTNTAVPLPPTATIPPTTEPTPIPTEEPVSEVSNCIQCHSDKQLLIDTASPEEEKEPSESSGVG